MESPYQTFQLFCFMPIGDHLLCAILFLSFPSNGHKYNQFINRTVMYTEKNKMDYKFGGSKVCFTSDTHFYHTNIIGFCKRPFKNVQDMNEVLIANWNRVVAQDDIVFHLGDFCLGGSHEWISILDRLNGKIYLILGNHDMKNIRQGYINRFESVAMQMYIEVDKQKIYLNHCPFLCYGGSYDGTWQLFGHVHTSKNNAGKDASRLNMLFPTQYDVGVDNNDFAPVSYEQVKGIINRQIELTNKK